MDKFSGVTAIYIIVGAFVAGYWIVSKLYQKKKLPKFGDAEESKFSSGRRESNSSQYQQHNENERQKYSDRVSYYNELLDLRGDYSPENIKKRYREMVAKYHPDKVSHLGQEFNQIAEKKTREINEAYDYYRQRFNLS